MRCVSEREKPLEIIGMNGLGKKNCAKVQGFYGFQAFSTKRERGSEGGRRKREKKEKNIFLICHVDNTWTIVWPSVRYNKYNDACISLSLKTPKLINRENIWSLNV